MMCKEDMETGWLEPGPQIKRKLFFQWQMARRGSGQADDMTNPVWEWLFRGRINPYRANQHFKGRIAKLLRKYDFPEQPRWSGERFGQSCSELSDGRKIWIAGEHEDHYDPDFFIYNDVIIEHPDGSVKILGYSDDVFRPTDFHTSTTVSDESILFLIGNLGYPDDRVPGRTQVYHLDTRDYSMMEVETTGDGPGWISKHQAKLTTDGENIVVTKGKVQTDNEFIDNIDNWSLSIRSGVWTRLTDRQWPQYFVRRRDDEMLHLWQYRMELLHVQMPKFPGLDDMSLEAALGCDPDMRTYQELFVPSCDHSKVEVDSSYGDAEDESDEEINDWNAMAVIIEGVRVKFVDDHNAVKIVIEGQLSEDKQEHLINEFIQKLSMVENSECVAARVR